MNCGVGAKVMSSKSICAYPWKGGKVLFVSSAESITVSSMCGGELSSSFKLLVMKLVDTKESNSML